MVLRSLILNRTWNNLLLWRTMKSRKPAGGTFFVNEDSSDSEEVHHIPRRWELNSASFASTTDISTSMSKTSISSSISRFRDDFDELKCKMRIFGESLNLCHCIANDFQNRMSFMEKRLQRLEDRHRLTTRESNYSAIIQKNQRLSNKTRQDAKVTSQSPSPTNLSGQVAKIGTNFCARLVFEVKLPLNRCYLKIQRNEK